MTRARLWSKKREYGKAIADLNEAIRLEPQNARSHHDRGLVWKAKGQYEQALADYAEAIRLDPQYASAYNNRAWNWATCPDARYRDGTRAVESATRVCEWTGWKAANTLGTLAAACAEAGDYDAAVKWQEQALALDTSEDDRRNGRARLALYQAKRPYHEQPRAR